MAAMSLPIEDYAMIGDLHTAAIVGRDGSIDWLCLPHFDSGACFARLLGTDDHGYWSIAPAVPEGAVTARRRRYRDGSLVLDTEMDTAEGTIRITDCMPIREDYPQVVRLVAGDPGHRPRADGAVHPFRLRRDHALGHPQRPSAHGDGGTQLGGAVDPRRDPRGGPAHGLGGDRQRGAADPLRAHLVPVAPAPAPSPGLLGTWWPTPRSGGAPGPVPAATRATTPTRCSVRSSP